MTSTAGLPARPRARGCGLPFRGRPGVHNAITDVPGVEVGYASLMTGHGPLRIGRGPVRTGVTIIHPRGRDAGPLPVWAAVQALNGNGELTGAHWIAETGTFLGPVAITNTHSVGVVHHAVTRWMIERYAGRTTYAWLLPVVAETYDGYLNDVNGQHVEVEHVFAALEGASGGSIAEGNVGGGVGMICYEFKGGTGSASRRVPIAGSSWTVGALVQANHGIRPWLTVLGVPVGEHMPDGRLWPSEQGSIIVVVATDAPLLPIQLRRIANRIGLGVGRTGTYSGDNSGDIFLAFSTANPAPPNGEGSLRSLDFLPNELLDPLFVAVVEAVEEAIINALFAAETMVGRDGHVVEAIDVGAVTRLMRDYGRLAG